jgi:hypothetical protein
LCLTVYTRCMDGPNVFRSINRRSLDNLRVENQKLK